MCLAIDVYKQILSVFCTIPPFFRFVQFLVLTTYIFLLSMEAIHYVGNNTFGVDSDGICKSAFQTILFQFIFSFQILWLTESLLLCAIIIFNVDFHRESIQFTWFGWRKTSFYTNNTAKIEDNSIEIHKCSGTLNWESVCRSWMTSSILCFSFLFHFMFYLQTGNKFPTHFSSILFKSICNTQTILQIHFSANALP